MKEREMNLQMHRVKVKFEIGALPGELNIDVPAYYDSDQVAKKTRAVVRKSYLGSIQVDNITIVDRKVIQ